MPKLFKMIIQAGSGNICNSVLIKKSKVIQGVNIEKYLLESQEWLID